MPQNPWDNDPVVRARQEAPRVAVNGRRYETVRSAYTQETPEELAAQGYRLDPETGTYAKVVGTIEAPAARPAPWEADPVAAARPLSGRLEAAASSASEQLFGLDKVAALAAGVLTGTPYSEVRELQGDLRNYDRETYPGARDVGGVAGFGATLALPGAAWVGGATRGAQIARAATVSAGYSGSQAFTQGEGSFAERLPRTGVATAVGAVGGAALQRGAQALGNFAQRMTSIASPRQPTPVAARVADFDRVGVDPMLAGVGGPLTQRTAQTLAGNVMTGGPVAAASARVRDQTIGAVDNLATQYGSAEGRGSAGAVLRRAAQEGADRFRQEGGSLYAPINALETNPTPIPLTNAQGAVTESLSLFTTPELRNWFARKATDLAEFEGLLQRTGGEASFAEARRLRSIVGQMLDDPEVFRSQSQAGLNRLYGALSDDIREGARAIGGEEAATALSRADRYYSAARGRADQVLKQFYGADTDAEAYNRLIQRAATKGNRSSWQQIRQLRDSVGPEEWGDIGAGVIRTLGDKGDGFSVAQFATEWEKMTPQARRVLFGGEGRTELFQDLNALARVAQTQRDAGRFYNFSESGNTMGNLAGASALGGAVVSAASGAGLLPLAAVIGAGSVGNGLARVLTSPRVARWAAGPTARAIPDGDQLARANPAFAEFWNANREAVVRLVAQNDNLPGRVAAAAEEQE